MILLHAKDSGFPKLSFLREQEAEASLRNRLAKIEPFITRFVRSYTIRKYFPAFLERRLRVRTTRPKVGLAMIEEQINGLPFGYYSACAPLITAILFESGFDYLLREQMKKEKDDQFSSQGPELFLEVIVPEIISMFIVEDMTVDRARALVILEDSLARQYGHLVIKDEIHIPGRD